MDDEKYYDDVISRVNRVKTEIREDVIAVDDSEVEEDYNILAYVVMLILFIAFFWDKGIGYVRL